MVDTGAEVKAAACAGMRPEAITEAQANANPELLNYAARETARWLGFGCKV